MKYALAFFVFAAALSWMAWEHGGWWRALLWPAASFLIVSFGYAGLGARVMGKDLSGRAPWWWMTLLLPFRVFVYASWWMQKSLSGELVCAEVTPGVWIGRRCAASELPPGVTLVIDLTSELFDPRGVRAGAAQDRDYLCLPTLDASAPEESATRTALDRIDAASASVYVHCAQGHGRAGTIAACLLVRRRLARDVDDAVRLLRQHRPGVGLSRSQRDFVRRITATPGPSPNSQNT